MTSTPSPHIVAAAPASCGFAHITTGSYRAMVEAIRAMSLWMPGSNSPQIARLAGHAIQHRRCGSVSSGTTARSALAPGVTGASDPAWLPLTSHDAANPIDAIPSPARPEDKNPRRETVRLIAYPSVARNSSRSGATW